ncbi:MAG TPA: penicillin-binding protein 2 [Alphaproteobacteria bacterium]
MATRLSDLVRSLPVRLRLEGTAKQSLETAHHRLVITGVLFALAFTIVALRLVDVTVLKEADEPRLARAPKAELQMDRADIVDRNGVLLATSLATASLYANPQLIIDPADAAAKLARTLPGIDAKEIAAKLSSDRSFVWLKRNLTPRQQYEVNRLGIPGLFFQREEHRVYPHGVLTSHVVGFTNIDNRGLAGIEQHYDEWLLQSSEPLQLSIDIRVQHLLREELAASIDEFQAIGGAAMVLDVATGELLGMVSLPDFDANNPSQSPPENRFNRNTLGVYEPGSTFKIFNTAMALDYGVSTLATSYDATKPIHVSRFTISDYKGKNRWLSVAEIFMYSSNIGSVRMMLDVGRERQREFLDRFGFLKAPTIELPEVAAPLVPSPWREVNAMTISFGHGISVTPLQLVAGTAAIVNGGILRPVTLVKRRKDEPVPGERVISARTSEQMRKLMRLVVEKGSGKSANVPGYLVGGKTGTAEKIVNGRYKKDSRISSFVGAFPMNAPRFLVYAMLDEPKGNKSTFGYATAGWVVAPMISRIVSRVAALYGIAPVDETEPAVRDQLLVNVAVR